MTRRERFSDVLGILQKDDPTMLVMSDARYANAFKKDFPGVADQVISSDDPTFQRTTKGKTLITDDFLRG